MPTARSDLGCPAYDGVLYAVGGNSGGSDGLHPVNTLEAYNVAANQWTPLPGMPTARYFLAAATYDGVLYAVGGASGSTVLQTLEAYTIETQEWVTLSPMPTARRYLAAAVYHGLLYVVGGCECGAGGGGQTPFHTLEAYTIATQHWSSLPDMPTARGGLAAAAHDGMLYAVGGHRSAALETYNTATQEWIALPNMPTPRTNLGAAIHDGVLYAVGGHDGNAVHAVEAYNIAMQRWSSLSSMPTARYSLAVSALNGVLYAVGGYNAGPLRTLEAYVLPRSPLLPCAITAGGLAQVAPWAAANDGSDLAICLPDDVPAAMGTPCGDSCSSTITIANAGLLRLDCGKPVGLCQMLDRLQVGVAATLFLHKLLFEELSSGGYPSYGGAIFLYENSDAVVSVALCTFRGNSAPGSSGGAINADHGCTLTVTNCQFESNQADNYGGGINFNGWHNSRPTFQESSGLIISSTSFNANAASNGNQGSAVYWSGHSPLSYSNDDANAAFGDGAGRRLLTLTNNSTSRLSIKSDDIAANQHMDMTYLMAFNIDPALKKFIGAVVTELNDMRRHNDALQIRTQAVESDNRAPQALGGQKQG